MSMMNCAQAVQAVLDGALDRLNSLIIIHVDGSADSKPVFGSRRLNLPLAGDAQLAFAVGCAQGGLLPVLDLRALKNAEEPLCQAVSELGIDALRPMIVRVCARTAHALPGFRVIAPQTPREAAGAMRYALRAAVPCVLIEDPLATYETEEVCEEEDSLFCGRWMAPDDPAAACPDELLPQDAADESPLDADSDMDSDMDSDPDWAEGPEPTDPSAAPDEAAAPADAPLPSSAPAPSAAAEPDAPPFCRALGSRCRPYAPDELIRTARLLAVGCDELARLCCGDAARAAEVVIETDSEPGEIALIPPREAPACLWVGRDRLALCWREDGLSPEEAKALIKNAAALLELPARLLLNRKD